MTWTPQQTGCPYVLISDQCSGADEACDPPSRNLDRITGSLYVPIPHDGESLHPGYFRRNGNTDEASEPGFASVTNLDGNFFVAMPTTNAMSPQHPIGSFVFFQDAIEREPVDGDVVYVSLATRTAPYTRRWWQFWKPRPTEGACFSYSLCIREFAVGDDGRVTLTPVDNFFRSWTEGIHKGEETRMRILGIATGHKPRGYYVSMVQS